MSGALCPADAPSSPVAFRAVSRSHVGRVRAINEDRVFDGSERGFWAVADGMGGHSGGDLAAQAIIEALRTLEAADTPVDVAAMAAALDAASAAIFERNQKLGLDAGATVVATTLAGTRLDIAWAGDSRAYLMAGGAARQLTRDHSFVQELIDAGLIDAAAAAHHPQANVVTRALGVRADAQLETISLDLPAGARLLLCSDGLSRSLAVTDFDRALPLEAQADALLANALARDGSDNVSLVLVEASA